jgi:hypothetical protein
MNPEELPSHMDFIPNAQENMAMRMYGTTLRICLTS